MIFLEGDNFMPEMHLIQPGFMYSASGTFTKSNEGIQKFKETGYLWYIYQSELDKARYGAYKDLPRRTASNRLITTKAFENYW